jgi:hypothetical protein
LKKAFFGNALFHLIVAIFGLMCWAVFVRHGMEMYSIEVDLGVGRAFVLFLQ